MAAKTHSVSNKVQLIRLKQREPQHHKYQNEYANQLEPALQLIRAKQAAKLLGISDSTFWRLISRGQLTRIKVTSSITAVALAEIQALIAAGTRG